MVLYGRQIGKGPASMEYTRNLDTVIPRISEILPELERSIESRLMQLSTTVRLNGALNRNSINIDVEVFFAEFLNILFDWDLREANFAGHNEPGIDLVSDRDKVVVQVSSQADRGKIEHSLEETPEKYKKAGYHFYFVTTKLDHPKYETDFSEFTEGLVFDVEKTPSGKGVVYTFLDVFDMCGLIDLASKSSHKIARLSEHVEEFFAHKQTREDLDLKLLGDWETDRINAFTFNSDSVDLFGREHEMQLLRTFANREGSFRWLAIAAAGGSGKTRLAYELQNELLDTGEWTCVEIRGEAWDRLTELDGLYQGKTLFIADYVSPHAEELGKWLKKLSQPGYKRRYPLRLLILERDIKDEYGNVSWYESVMLPDRENIIKTRHSEIIKLGKIEDGELLRLIRDYANKAEAKDGDKLITLENGDEKKVLDRLKSIDPELVRPLFALMLTDAWLRDEDAPLWSEKELLRDIVRREISHLEKRIQPYHSGANASLSDSCRLLWAAATILGTNSNTDAEALLNRLPGDVQLLKKHVEAHKSVLFDKRLDPHIVLLRNAGIYERKRILPMLPDILGEFFVMNEMKRLGREDRAELLSAVLEDRRSALEFFKRLLKDFGTMMTEDEKLRKGVFPEEPGLELPHAAEYATLLQELYETTADMAFREHFFECVSALKKSSEADSVHYADILRAASNILRERGKYADALECNEEELRLRIAHQGEDDPETATAINDIARLHNALGAYDRSMEYNRRALQIREKALGENHTDTATSYNNLAGDLQAKGDYDAALKYYKKAVEIKESTAGPEHRDTATAYGNIAGVYRAMGDYDSALEYHKKALEIREKVLGTDHPDTATSYNSIAGVYRAMGDYGSALEYNKKALGICEKVLGTDHPDTAGSYSNIAQVYQAMGDYDSAIEYMKKALEIAEKVLGTDHPDTATTYNNIANVYYDMGDYDSALEYNKKALKIYEKVLGTDHPDTAGSYNNIAQVYQAMGDYDSALEYMKKGLAISEKVLGTDHPSTAIAYNNIGGLYLEQGKPEEALPELEKALNVFESKLGPEHPYTVSTRRAKEYAEGLLQMPPEMRMLNILLNKLPEDEREKLLAALRARSEEGGDGSDSGEE